MKLKNLILTMSAVLSLTACNGGASGVGGDGSPIESTGQVALLNLPDYGNCKNEKLCVTNINPKTKNYGNNTLQNIPVGSFGLVGYTIINQTKFDMPSVFVDQKTFPSDEFSIDPYRSTCLNNMLSPKEECDLVLKYKPLNYGQKGDWIFTISSEKFSSPKIDEFYYSRTK